MKSLPKWIRLLFLSSLLISYGSDVAIAADVRKPAVAGLWYPANRQKLEQLIAHLTVEARKTPISIPPVGKLRALMMPHAGFVYSGLTAAHVSRVIEQQPYRKVILLGPDHRVGLTNGAISDVNAYQTPLGLVRLHEDAKKLRLDSTNLFHFSRISDRYEHSLEAILPFLQTYLEEFELIPIVLGPSDIQQIADTIDPLRDQDTLLVISSDLSHFLTYSEARDRDRQTIDLILKLQSPPLIDRENSACGKIPILVMLELARRHQWKPVLLHYANSGDTAGDKDRVVGYAAIAFFEPSNPSESTAIDRHHFNQKQGQDLIRLARLTIMDRLGVKVDTSVLTKDLAAPCFQKRCGTFVTLTKGGKLRGCIGNLDLKFTVREGIKRNSIRAALNDPRFPPLKPDELENIEISVSILTQPRPLKYTHSAELCAKLRVHEDGVIIRNKRAGATFLPQVWAQLPTPEQFLTHLCLKAGLPPDAWRYSGLEVWTYQVQYFEEKQ